MQYLLQAYDQVDVYETTDLPESEQYSNDNEVSNKPSISCICNYSIFFLILI